MDCNMGHGHGSHSQHIFSHCIVAKQNITGQFLTWYKVASACRQAMGLDRYRATEESTLWAPFMDLSLDVILNSEHSLVFQLWHICCGTCAAKTPCFALTAERTGSAVVVCAAVHNQGSTGSGGGKVGSQPSLRRCAQWVPAAQHESKAPLMYTFSSWGQDFICRKVIQSLSPACQTTTEKLTINLNT